MLERLENRAQALGEARAARVRASLAERARRAVEAVGPELGGAPAGEGAGWRLVSLVMLRARLIRETGPGWTSASEYRARMLRAAPG
jgi:hypothetical protein